VASAPPLISNRYQVLAPLGSGGQADAYTARDTYEGDVVAIKLLQRVPESRPWLEAEALRALSDPHILPIRNADTDAGRPYIVTELATHGTLEKRLEESHGCGLDVDSVIRAIRHACAGTGRAHAARLIHNDIKPGNLFLNAEGECMLGDFGGACLLPAGANGVAPFVTTAQITAPEIAANWGAPLSNVRSDVYSLGASAYWLLTARPPYLFQAGAGFQERLALVSAEPPPRLRDLAPHVPNYVGQAIERAMHRDPVRRFESAAAFAAALGARPAIARAWMRTDEHENHEACWRGQPTGSGSTYVVCLEQGERPTQVVISAKHLTSGIRISAGCRTVPMRTVAQALRSVFRALG
jgi:eukaryotic-like serine/threonine-protein kinase